MTKKIIPYSKTRMEDAGKQTGWHRQKGNIIVSNEKMGYYTHHTIETDDEGNPSFDRLLNAERGGGVFLPEDESGKFGLQINWRPQARDFKQYQTDFPDFHYSSLGRNSYEIPRGFAHGTETGEQAMVREAQEETQGSVVSKTSMKEICDNTAFHPHLTSVAYGTVDLSKKPVDAPDPNEKIVQKLDFYSIREIAELRKSGDLYCCYTLAAMMARMLDEPEKFFKPELLY